MADYDPEHYERVMGWPAHEACLAYLRRIQEDAARGIGAVTPEAP